MSEPIEYGIRYPSSEGERWAYDSNGVLIHVSSIGAARVMLNEEMALGRGYVAMDYRICAFGPDGEPLELGEVASQTGLKAIELLQRYEWVLDTNGKRYCPECEQWEVHGWNCELDALLREVGSE
jgi:hypothetical protein